MSRTARNLPRRDPGRRPADAPPDNNANPARPDPPKTDTARLLKVENLCALLGDPEFYNPEWVRLVQFRCAEVSLAVSLTGINEPAQPVPSESAGWTNCRGCGQPLGPDWNGAYCKRCSEALTERIKAQSPGGELSTMARITGLGPEPKPEPDPADEPDSIGYLFERMRYVPETAQSGTESICTRAAVLAQLHQAEALGGIFDLLADIASTLHNIHVTMIDRFPAANGM